MTITTRAPNTILSNVYAQIVNFAGAAGQEGCNSVPAPPGLDLQLRALVHPGDEQRSGDAELGIQVCQFIAVHLLRANHGVGNDTVPELLAFPSPDEGIVDNGTGVVYSDYNTPRLVFLEQGGGGTWNWSPSVGLPDYAWALAKDVARSRIWYATTNEINLAVRLKSYVGYVTSGDHGASGSSVVVENAGSTTSALRPWSIKTDPALDRAWFVASDWTVSSDAYTGARLFYVDVAGGAVSAPVQVSSLDGLLARSLAFGPDGKIYVTLAPTIARPNGAIQRCTDVGCGGTTLDVISLAATCADPSDILIGPGNKLWFTAKGPTGGVCTLDPAGDVIVRVADAPNPGYLAVGAGRRGLGRGERGRSSRAEHQAGFAAALRHHQSPARLRHRVEPGCALGRCI